MNLWLPRPLWCEMEAHVAGLAPQEACGLLAGRGSQAQAVYPVRNELASPTHFRMDAAQQWVAFQRIQAAGQALLAIYHSHPAGPDHPSQQDLQQAGYPGVTQLIWSPQAGLWGCAAFCFEQGAIKPVELTLQDE